jgi:CubicO group peptidase (beta-lactamase class C family)
MTGKLIFHNSSVPMIRVPLLIVLLLSSCSKKDEEPVNWQPENLNDGLQVSGPREQGMDSAVLYNLYVKANNLDNLYGLLVVKNGYLIAEKYFNGTSVTYASSTASVTKSITSALAGIAIKEGFITGKDQKLKDFFPEIDWESTDPRKSEITVEQMLQMRSGYPWEESDGYLNTLFQTSNWIPLLSQFLLMQDLGTQFGYSNLTAHIIGILISRSSKKTLLAFAKEYLFDDMLITVPYWPADISGYYYGMGDICLTPRSLAKFGQLYLRNGVWNDIQLIPSEWVDESLSIYSASTYGRDILIYIRNLQYGYLWWSGTSGSHQIWYAWGHGGQMIVIIRDLNMVIVATATPQPTFDNYSWQKESSVMELVGRFITNI